MNYKQKTSLKNVLSTRVNLGEKLNFNKIRKSRIPSYRFRGCDQKVQSLDTGVGNATKGSDKVYTGSAMLGVVTMHKSNAIPIFNQQAAIDVSNMRR